MNYPYNPGLPPMFNNYGWICPKCGAVHSPMTPTCSKCNHNANWSEIK